MWGINDILTHSLAYGMGEEEEKAKAEREKKASNNWHTGTPTEEGWYLVTNGDDDSASYDIGKWDGESFCYMEYLDSAYVVAWQKIDPYKEKKDGR